MRHLLFLLTAFILLSCSRSDKEKNAAIFTPSILPVQAFIVDNARDTILKTLHGSVIRISAGSFESKGKVKLEIKEAISPAEILAAGMMTESNGQPLGSGGMIYINTVEKNIALLRPISISIPTNSIEPAMQVFKGIETDSGRINWTDPQPLDSTPLQNSIAFGKAIFRTKCIACHTIFRKMTGPSLANLESRGPWKDRQQLYRWISNPSRFMSTDQYTQQLRAEYGSMMTGFADLGQEGVNAIADYIKNESNRPGAFEEEIRFNDSLSKAYNMARPAVVKDSISYDQAEAQLYPDSNNCRPYSVYLPDLPKEPFFLNTDTSKPDMPLPIPEFSEEKPEDASSMEGFRNGFNDLNSTSGMYDFTIKTLGWYNVDYFVNGFPGTVITQVNALVRNADKRNNLHIYLFCPRNKMLSVSNKNDGNEFSFDKINGGVPLFLQDRAILFAFTSDDEKILYSIREFAVQKTQTIELTLKESTESEIKKALHAKQLEGIQLDVQKKEKKTIYPDCNSKKPDTLMQK
jgi:mono/diheme cytochrome c family protein